MIAALPSATYLPGCVRLLTLDPAPRWPIVLRNTRALHGMLTALRGIPHDKRVPTFALVPMPGHGCGWAAQWLDGGARSLPTRNPVNVYGSLRTLTLGPPMALRMPARPDRGALVCVDTISPVVVRATQGKGGISLTRTEPDADNIRSALWMGPWLCQVDSRPMVEGLEVEIVASDTRPAIVDCGVSARKKRIGGDGRIRGFEGRLILRVNALAWWRLLLAERLGLGGRIGFGFGRIRVLEVTP